MADGNAIMAGHQWHDWVRAPGWTRLEDSDPLRIVDLFSGCGGMTLGAYEGAKAEGRGAEVALAIDISEAALDVFRDNFRADNAVAQNEDIRKILDGSLGSRASSSERRLRARVGEVDFLLAGPPCQGHSDLNNHSRRADPRNGLYLCAIRAIEVLRPSIAIIENVPTVVHDRGGVVPDSQLHLRRLGYNFASRVVRFVEFGVPQTRRRHLTIASRTMPEDALTQLLVPSMTRSASVRDFIADLESRDTRAVGVFDRAAKQSIENRDRIAWLFDNDAYDLPDHLRPPCHRDRNHSYKSMYGRLKWDEPAQTITSGFGSMGQGRFVHPSCRRTLTCHEAARIQGFPDFFSFDACDSLTGLREMIGNAVPPQFVAAVVAGALKTR